MNRLFYEKDSQLVKNDSLNKNFMKTMPPHEIVLENMK